MIIWEAELVPDPLTYEGRVPGRIIKTSEDYVDVLTGDSYLRINHCRINDLSSLPIFTINTMIYKYPNIIYNTLTHISFI